MRKGPPTITVQFTQADFDMIHQFAYRAGASVAQVMKIGILRLITQAERGEVENLLPEFRPDQPGKIGNA